MNWVAFMDCILQMNILHKDSRSLILPTRIQKLRINSKDHMAIAGKMGEEDLYFDVIMNPELGIIQAGGIEIIGMTASPVSRRKAPGNVILGSYKFLPYVNMKVNQTDALRAFVQMAIENSQITKIRAVEVRSEGKKPIIGNLRDILSEIPSVAMDLKLISDQECDIDGITVENVKLSSLTNYTFVVVTDLLNNQFLADDALKCIADGGYLISRENLSQIDFEPPHTFNVLATIITEDERLILLEPVKRKIFGSPKTIKIDSTQFEWVHELRESIKETAVILFSQSEPTSGLIGFINCLRKESEYKNVKGFFVDDVNAPPFSLTDPFYTKQLKLGLAINVYRNVSRKNLMMKRV